MKMYAPQRQGKPTVLCVDDEENILKSLRRVCRPLDVNLLFAKDGESALRILQNQSVDVIVSDMQMPGMNGAKLLENAARLQPDSYRMLLTGYADTSATADAVNLGKIQAYIQKPWDNANLIRSLQQGLNATRQQLHQRNVQRLLQAQNTQLENVNADMARRDRLRARVIRDLSSQLSTHKQSAVTILSQWLYLLPQLDHTLAQQIAKLSRALAKAQQLTDEQIEDCYLAGLLCEFGLLGCENGLTETPFNQLSRAKQLAYFRHASMGRELILQFSQLDTVAEYIGEQFTTLSPENVDEPTLAVRIVAVCRDYCRYRLGRITGKPECDRDIRQTMTKYTNIRYDQRLLSALWQHLSLASLDIAIQRNEDLVPGMVLLTDMQNEAGSLLLKAGHIFTAKSIQSLQRSLKQPDVLVYIAHPEGEYVSI